jgi:hypothetical protein
LVIRNLKLINIQELVETEEHNQNEANNLAKKIAAEGFWVMPITIESRTFGIMDGHHRFAAAKVLGCKRVPCVLLNYLNGGVILKSWDANYSVTPEDFLIKITSNEKFPYKTTRHIFKPPISETKIPLSMLF